MRSVMLAALVVGMFAGAVPAQSHPGGVLMGGGYPFNSSNYLNGMFVVSKSGKFTTLIDTFTAQRPNYLFPAAMGTDNNSVVFGSVGSTNPAFNLTYGVFRWDANTLKFTTLARSTMDFVQIYGLAATQDGNWYVSAYGYTQGFAAKQVIYELTPGSTWNPVMTTLQLGYYQTFPYPIGRDVDSGDLLIPSNNTVGFFSRPVYALSHDGTITTWNMSSGGPFPTYGWTQEVATGDMLNMSGNYIYRTAKGRKPYTTTPVTVAGGESMYAAVFDNQTEAKPLLIGYSYSQQNTFTSGNLQFIDPTTSTVTRTVNFLKKNTLEQLPYPLVEILNHQSRYLQTVNTGNGKWDLLLNFPAFPRKGYVLAAGYSGVRPGILLKDGRHIWLNFDDLLRLTVDNKISPVFNPGPLVLDATGKAKGEVNVSFLFPPLNITIHIIAAVIDGSAPGGIGFITEPYPMNL